MTLLLRISLAKKPSPTDGELLDNREEDEADIDRWENDGGMNFKTRP